MGNEIEKDFRDWIRRILALKNQKSKKSMDVIEKEMTQIIEKEKQKAFMDGYRYAISILLESIADNER